MSMLSIKRELPALRCEICHQADCFTPETNVCTRCAGVQILGKSETVVHSSPVFETLSRYQRQASLGRDRAFRAISALLLLMVVIGWFFGNDNGAPVLWKIAGGLTVLLLAFAVFFKKEENFIEGIDDLFWFANVIFSFAPIGLLILFFLFVLSVRYC